MVVNYTCKPDYLFLYLLRERIPKWNAFSLLIGIDLVQYVGYCSSVIIDENQLSSTHNI